MDTVFQAGYTSRVIAPGIELIIGDSTKILPLIDDLSYDLCFLDPPYNVGKNYGQGAKKDRMEDWVYDLFVSSILFQSLRIAKLVVATPGCHLQHIWMRPPHYLTIWYKGMSGVVNIRSLKFGRSFISYEPVIWYTRRPDLIFVDIKNYLCGPPEPGRGGHPNSKPLWLMNEILRMAKMESVIDPFCGTGTMLQAAQYQGYRALGIELNPEYEAIITSRFSQQLMELTAPRPQQLTIEEEQNAERIEIGSAQIPGESELTQGI